VEGAPAAAGVVPAPDPAAPERYRRLHQAIRDGLVLACHDVSEGGLGVALAEMCIAGRLGIAVRSLPDREVATALFAESLGRLVVEVAPRDLERFRRMLGSEVTIIGDVTEDDDLVVPGMRPLAVSELADAFNRVVFPEALT
jgi:phosphoribosylformylglycinamidine synthase subunit PurSL